MKKLFLLLVLCLCSLASWAQRNFDFRYTSMGQLLYYKYEGDLCAEVVHPNSYLGNTWGGYTQPTGSLTIPSRVQYGLDTLSVTGIGEYAFLGCSSLTSVTIPNSVTGIGESAFRDCSSLTSVAIPNSVTTIEEFTFYHCSGLTSVTIGDSVTTIGMSAFSGCSGLSTLNVPNSVTSIEPGAFNGIDTVYYGGSAAGSPWDAGVVIIPGYTEEGDPLVYESPNKTMVVGCSDTVTSVTIPSSVTTIGNGAFRDCSSLASITIPDSVTIIGAYAFQGCSGLTSVTIGESVTTIDYGAFYGCTNVTTLNYNAKNLTTDFQWVAETYGFRNIRLQTLVIGDGVETLPEFVFNSQIGLSTVTIPNSVVSIGNYAFWECRGLTSVTIGESVTVIGQGAFRGCSGLTSVTIPDSVTTIGSGAFRGCSGITGSLTIPNSVTTIGANAFDRVDTIWYCGTAEGRPWGAQKVMGLIQDGLCFQDCDMTIVNGFADGLIHADIPDGVTTIAANAFENCSTLTTVTIPESVTIIGNNAFVGCTNVTTLNYNAKNLTTSADWYNNSEDYNTYGFRWMQLQTLVIGDSVKTLPAGVFYGQDDLTSVTIPESVTTIEKHAFEGCTNVETLYYNATNLTTDNFWHNALDSNNSYGFRPMRLRTLVIGDNVETIPQGVFYNQQGLTTLTIPESVSRIETAAFYRCSNVTTLNYNATNLSGLGNNVIGGFRPMKLHTLVIGDNVETLPDSVFYSQTDLTNVTLPNSLTSIGAFAFYNDSNLTNLTLPESLTSIGNYAFAHCKRFPTLDFPESLNSIGAYAFYNCSALTTLTIPETLTSIGNSAFAYCKGLTSVSLPESMTSLSNGVFYECSGLTSVTLPNAVTTIGADAFRGCTNLVSITIPNSVTSIGNNAFMGCNGLTYVTLPNAISIIEDNTFNGCSSLAHITIPNSVTTIDIYAFQNCTSLTNVTIPNSVTTIGAYAFSGCTGLESIVIGKSVNSFGDGAFDNCTSLWTIYNLSVWNIVPSSTNFGYGRVAVNAKRVLSAANGDFTIHGTGENTLYRIDYDRNTISDADDVDGLYNIPRSTVPANFIYYYNSNQKGWSWKANEIFLTDDTSRFVAPVAFTAEKATYTREFTNSNRSTLYLPFTAAVPEGFEVYDFAGFNGSTISFSEHSGNIAAYTPYLVGYDLSKEGSTTLCTITQSNAVFPQTSAASPAYTTTYSGMTFKGTVKRTCMTSNNYGYRDGFFVQSGNGSDHSGHAHVNPFRAYFAYTAPAGAPQNLPSVLNVEVGYGDPVGIDAVETPEQECDGRYGNDVYDMLGRLVRKNADNLKGLPQGIYIWKGKKVVRGER